jgi:hypothetical protein
MKSAGASEEEINNALSRIGTVKVAPNDLGPSIEVPSRKDIGGVDLTANNKEVVTVPLTVNKEKTPEKVVKVTAGEDDPTVFDPLSKTTMKKSELDALTIQRQAPNDSSVKPEVKQSPASNNVAQLDANANNDRKDWITVPKNLVGTKAESIISLSSVVDELLNEAGATTMPMGNDKSVWQSTKDAVGKGVDAVKGAIPQPVKDVAKVVADHPVTKFAGKALGPVTTAINAPSIPHDAADAFRLSDKGDSVGSFLKGAQAAVNTAMIPTTAAALIPSPIMPAAAIADAGLGLTSLGLSGAEYVRDKYFPYKGKDTADAKSESANEELNRVLTLTQYKVGK